MCIRDRNKTDHLEISYVVSGVGQKEVALKIYEEFSDNRIATLFQQQGQAEFSHTFEAKKDNQIVKICFENQDSNKKNLQFDFKLISEKQKDLVTKDDLGQLMYQLKSSQRGLFKIYENQQIQQIRDETHAKRLEKIETKVKWSSILKISILILLCIAQIYVLTGLFSKKSASSV
eukprot:TRINITY_DN7142_c0_g1_i1.p1 TRINITY_DN7142_c0_g1~~TRINITY_DN7142_c0_g1_i1.p1  ORF type:complete len:175 (+),score=30.07 TRINITY_DN7142_c0_g1_i1:138-662(+)